MSSTSLSPETDLCATPAARPPDGSEPDFRDAQWLQTFAIGIGVVLITLSVVVTAGRLYANKNCLRLADYLVTVGLVFNVVVVGINLSLSKLYRHTWDVPVCWIEPSAKPTFAESIFITLALFLPREAIFLYYLQIFSVSKMVRIGAKIGIVLTFLVCVAQLVITACLKGLENRGDANSDYFGNIFVIFSIATRCPSVLLDTYIFILPIPTLVKLNMPLSKRIRLGALFATALIGIIIAAASIVYRIKILYEPDIEWWIGSSNLLTMIEVDVTMIVASLPGFATFWRVYVANAYPFKLLRQKRQSSRQSKSPAEYNSRSTLLKPHLWTFGSSQQRQQPRSPELETCATLETHITAPAAAVTTAHPSFGMALETQEKKLPGPCPERHIEGGST
ncbi:hypothetical protein F5X96DRAFT_649346 [Biscogniauxia mediterranea]|nr:hypothetical protein F5X96DRAFT_649346 [Biscogniauxia mediterranea]